MMSSVLRNPRKRGRGAVSGNVKQAWVSKETVSRAATIQQSMIRSYPTNDVSSDDESFDLSPDIVSRTLEQYRKVLVDSDDGCNDSYLSTLGFSSCLICLSGIRRTDSTWACIQCYCLFHLPCIQAWARDAIKGYKTSLSLELFPHQDCFWTCPKCRHDYRKQDIPIQYLCYCGKSVDPPVDAWFIPHSCGEVCGHRLSEHCQHACLSLCHPGPCPPCPQTVTVPCFCGKASPQVKRCGVQKWSCGRVCGRVLSCGLHTCEEHCHDRQCAPCEELVIQNCLCGKETKNQSCDNPVWSCGNQCRNTLPCGNHLCEQVCHSGGCGECPRAGPRTCPCGKTEHILPCLDEVTPCGDTCNKVMSCGVHRCQRMCHTGDCGQCLQVISKTCRCGKKRKSLVCSQELLCETRCQKLRDCGNHMCKRKCCDGQCSPCEQVCNRQLGCKNHKCQSPCHQGPCYPCTLSVGIYCHCRATKRTVPCGRDRETKPPKCRELCTIPSSCNHPVRKPHSCHTPPCPPCDLVCGLSLSCAHSCMTPCHSTPKLQPQARPTGLPPWVKLDSTQLAPVVAACPPCQFPVEKLCKGGHECATMACSDVRDFSCGRECGRLLGCTNHYCKRGCHLVIDAPSHELAGDDCLQCINECLKPRPLECVHPCSFPCHPGECPPCEVLLRILCHCKTLPIFNKCCEWCAAGSSERDAMICCGGQCTNTLECGHCCPLTCHAGDCVEPTDCSRRVSVRCRCGRIKKESRCSVHKTIYCDEECEKVKRERKQVRLAEECRQRDLKLRQEKEADEALQRQLQPRKRKRKPKLEIEVTPKSSLFCSKSQAVIVLCLLVCLFLVGVVWFLSS